MDKFNSATIVLGSNRIGGSEIQIKRLSEKLVKDYKINVTIVFAGMPNINPFKKTVDFIGINKIYYLYHNKFLNKKYSLKLFDLIFKNYNSDLYYCIGTGIPLLIANKLNKEKFPNIIIGIRNERFVYEKEHYSFISKYLPRRIKIICNSNIIKRSLVENNLAIKENINIINNGINLKSTSNKNIKNVYNVMFCGNLRKVKDPMFFLNVVKAMTLEIPEINYIVVGDGPLKKKIQEYILTNNISDKIKLIGHVKNDLIPYYSVDLLFNSSKSEGCSNSILEALSNGIPVVASNTPGNKEILYNKKFGYLFKKGDLNSAIKGITHFYSQKVNNGISHYDSAETYIKKSYSIENMVDQHIKYFNYIIKI